MTILDYLPKNTLNTIPIHALPNTVPYMFLILYQDAPPNYPYTSAAYSKKISNYITDMDTVCVDNTPS